MSNRFNVGDVVQLKSGGPFMTVYAVCDLGTADASWHTAVGEPREERYDLAMLRRVSADELAARERQGKGLGEHLMRQWYGQ